MMNPPRRSNDGFHYFPDRRSAYESIGLPNDRVQLVHYYGGGYLNCYWLEEKIWLCELLQEQGFDFKKLIFTGQGLGPFFCPIRKVGSNLSFGKRPGWEPEKHRREGPGSVFSFDDSIAFYDPGGKEAWSFIPKRWGKMKIGVNLRAEPYADLNQNDLLEPLRKIICFCSSRGYQLMGFCLVENTHYSDRRLFRSLGEKMGLPLKLFPKPADYRKGRTGVSQFSILITGSYHGALMALYSGVAVIALYNSEYYKKKFKGLAEIINNPMFRPLPVNNLSDTHIEQALLSRNPGKPQRPDPRSPSVAAVEPRDPGPD